MMGATAAVAGIASAGVGIASAYGQSQAASAQGAYQKQQYDANATLATMQASDAITQGNKAASLNDQRTEQMIGSERAASGASGVDVNSGSAAETQQDTAGLGALDSLAIKNNAWRTAWGYQNQANNYTGQGAMDQLAGQNKATNSLLTGGMSAISASGSAIYNYNKAG